MITYYYLNRDEIEKQYAQIVPYVMSAYEDWVSNTIKTKGKLTIGSFLQSLGLNLGGVDGEAEWDRSSGHKMIQTLTHEQKLALIWKDQKKKHQLLVMTSEQVPILRIGQPILFEGYFTLSDWSATVANLEGKVGNSAISMFFSKSYMPASILETLQYRVNNAFIGGYGVIMGINNKEITLRPIAFGLNFVSVFK